jgi:selenium metabolism protein YedF
MKNIIDAKGLACPQPVILTKQALESKDEITVIVDNATAVENVRRMGTRSGCEVDIEKKRDGTFHLHLSRKGKEAPSGRTEKSPDESAGFTCMTEGPMVVVISSDKMGKGNDELGQILMRSFIHTLLSLSPMPETLIFYNTGVKMAVKGSDVLDDLKELEKKGVSILVCGTCLNYFGISNDLACGTVSNMYDITSSMSAAGRLVVP